MRLNKFSYMYIFIVKLESSLGEARRDGVKNPAYFRPLKTPELRNT